MFSSEDIFSEQTNFLDGVQEAKGYDGVDGIIRIISENYENEMIVENYMAKADMKEMKMVSESASAEDIQAHQEASVSGVYNYLKGVLQRFWAKIKAVFMRFYQKIRTWFAKRIAKRAKNKASNIKPENFWDNLGNYKAEDKTSFELKNIALPKDPNGIVGYFEYTEVSYDAVASVVASKGLDDSTDLRDTAFGSFTNKLLGKSFDYDSFKSDYHEMLFKDEDDLSYDDLNSNKTALKDMCSSKKLQDMIKTTNTNIRKIEAAVNKEIKKVTKKQKISGESEQLKYENKAISLTNTFVSMCSNAYFRETMFYFSQASKAISFALSKAFAVKKANTESAGFGVDDALPLM